MILRLFLSGIVFTFVLSNLAEMLIENHASSCATYILDFAFKEWLWSVQKENSVNHVDSNSLGEITKVTVLMNSNSWLRLNFRHGQAKENDSVRHWSLMIWSRGKCFLGFVEESAWSSSISFHASTSRVFVIWWTIVLSV